MCTVLVLGLVGVRTITLHRRVNSPVSTSHLAAIIKREQPFAELSCVLAKSFIDGPISFPNV